VLVEVLGPPKMAIQTHLVGESLALIPLTRESLSP
jgi:hypothetical protein